MSNMKSGKYDYPQSSKTTAKKIDYLAEMRMQRENAQNMGEYDGSGYRKINNERTIDQLMNDHNLNEYERLDAVKRKADQMENQAKRREKLIKVAQAGGADT